MAADRATALVAALLLGCVGVFAIMAGPIVTEALVVGRGLSAAQAGQITAAEALGTALGPVLAMFWMGRLRRRTAAVIALLVVIAGNIFTSTQSDMAALAGIRFVVGLLGEGTCFALAVAILAGTAQKDRNFAFLIAAQVVLGVLMFLLLPFPRDAGTAGVLLPLAGFSALALLASAWIPEPDGAAVHHAAGAAGGSTAPAIIALVVMLVWCTGLGSIWFFIKLIGADITGGEVGAALAITTATATVGALFASWLGDRAGRLLPVTAALLVQVAMIALLQGEMSLTRFTVITAIFQTFWNLTGPYVMGTVAMSDTTGRVSLLIPTAQIFGFFLGPVVAGQFLTEGHGYGPANVVAIVCFLVALALFIPTALRLRGR